MLKSAMSILLLIATFCLNAQNHPYIANLKAQQVNNRLLVEWTTKAGFSCQDIMVQLSEDSIDFSTKATYYGLCGDTTEKRYSLFIEDPIANAVNFVRLDLGQYGYSDVISVKFILQTRVSIHPNPIQENSKIYLNNPFHDEMTVRIFNSKAKLVSSAITYERTLLLSDLIIDRGIYFYTVHRNGVAESHAKVVY